MVFMTATLCLTTYFEDNIGIAMSIGSAGSSIGGMYIHTSLVNFFDTPISRLLA